MLVHAHQHDREIVGDTRALGIEVAGAPQRRLGLLQPVGTGEHSAQQASGQGGVGRQSRCDLQRIHGAFVLAEAFQHDAPSRVGDDIERIRGASCVQLRQSSGQGATGRGRLDAVQRDVDSGRRQCFALGEGGTGQIGFPGRHQDQAQPVPGAGVGRAPPAPAQGTVAGLRQGGQWTAGASSATTRKPGTGAPASRRMTCGRMLRTANPASRTDSVR